MPWYTGWAENAVSDFVNIQMDFHHLLPIERGTQMSKKYVYLFTEGNGSMRELLGGKGANLAEMTNTRQI